MFEGGFNNKICDVMEVQPCTVAGDVYALMSVLLRPEGTMEREWSERVAGIVR